MIYKHGIAVGVLLAAAVAPACAQAPVRSERIQFPRGASSTVVRGAIRGNQGIDYVVSARAGQTITVSLRSASKSVYFNVLPPRSQQAVFNGAIGGSRYSGTLSMSGDYRLRVYLMRNAARRGERAEYTLSVAVVNRPGQVLPGRLGQDAGRGQAIAPGNMTAFCRGEASAKFGVRPAYVITGRLLNGRNGTRTIDGSVDRQGGGDSRFRCTFDGRGRFVGVVNLKR